LTVINEIDNHYQYCRNSRFLEEEDEKGLVQSLSGASRAPNRIAFRMQTKATEGINILSGF
jgi:hypothetical protein